MRGLVSLATFGTSRRRVSLWEQFSWWCNRQLPVTILGTRSLSIRRLFLHNSSNRYKLALVLHCEHELAKFLLNISHSSKLPACCKTEACHYIKTLDYPWDSYNCSGKLKYSKLSEWLKKAKHYFQQNYNLLASITIFSQLYMYTESVLMLTLVELTIISR